MSSWPVPKTLNEPQKQGAGGRCSSRTKLGGLRSLTGGRAEQREEEEEEEEGRAISVAAEGLWWG